MIVPLVVGREKSVLALDEALKGDRLIFLAAQRLGELEEPSPEDIHELGTVAIIVRMLKTPDGKAKILVQGLQRAKIVEYLHSDPHYSVHLDVVKEQETESLPVKLEALVRATREGLVKLIQLGRPVPPDVLAMAENVDDPGRLADLVGSSLGLGLEEAQRVLEAVNPTDRLMYVHEILNRETRINEMQQQIQDQTRQEMNKTQREYFLRQQLKTIQQELGEKDERDEEVEELKKRIEKVGMPAEVRKEVEKQLSRLSKMHPDSAEAAIIRTYSEWMVEIPWKKSTRDKLDIVKAQKVLDEDHYDLEKVKERILEYLGVLKLKKELKGPILCFVGPPGVGKTSLGRSIARAMGRNFVRMSLGGIRDEAEIRGHRRTYVGALPGRIIQGMKQAGSRNPVFMLDEIDKLGADFRGDPSSALLEVLDPEQNHAFRDHYLAVPYDLSAVMFIATANMADQIPAALYDRMEVIRLAGYSSVEKRHIARKYLVPRQMDRNGISDGMLTISEGALDRIILEHTREAGVRNLEREIGSIFRKVAKKIAMSKPGAMPGTMKITSNSIRSYLGAPKFIKDQYRGKARVGVATGLAWTPVGGDTLDVEVSAVKGKGTLTLTGSLGDVMKESAQAALTYIRSRISDLGLTDAAVSGKDIHVHVPAGATPKDGPSAGVAIAIAMVSALSGKPPSSDVAMTGEISLTGRVLPIGGLREKLLAAKRAGMKKVVIPVGNLPEVEEIPGYVTRSVDVVTVSNMDEALKAVFPAGSLAAARNKKRRGKALARKG